MHKFSIFRPYFSFELLVKLSLKISFCGQKSRQFLGTSTEKSSLSDLAVFRLETAAVIYSMVSVVWGGYLRAGSSAVNSYTKGRDATTGIQQHFCCGCGYSRDRRYGGGNIWNNWVPLKDNAT